MKDFSGISSRCTIYAESDDYSGKFLTNPTVPDEYLLIISNILSGTYLPIKADTSGKPILFFIKVKILSNISIIAIKKTKDENLLKNITTTKIKIIKTIKSIYIFIPPYDNNCSIIFHQKKD